MSTRRRSPSGSPDTSNKRFKSFRDDSGRHHEYRYEDEDSSRSRYRDDRDDDRHHPKLYRVDDRGDRRDNSHSRHRDNDGDRHRDGGRYRHDHRDRYHDDDRRERRHHYSERDSYSERRRDKDRERERSRERERDRDDRDGRRAEKASPRHSADNRSRSPRHSSPTTGNASPAEVSKLSSPNNVTQKSQITDVQRARLEKMEQWKKKKAEAAAAAAAKAKETPTTPEPVTNGRASADAAKDVSNGSPLSLTVLNSGVGDSKPIPSFGFTRASAKSSDSQTDLQLDDEDDSKREIQLVPVMTAEDEARINAAPPVEEDAEDKDTKLEDDDEEERKHLKREENEDMKMDIEEDYQRPSAKTEPSQKMDIEDEDPLDAFMHDVVEEARRIDEADQDSFRPRTGGRVLMGEDDDDGPDLNSDGELPEQHYAKEAKKGKTKEVTAVDHSKINYEPFNKSFYIPPPEYENLTKEEIADLRLELSGITIRGKDAPIPVTKWSHCGLNAPTLDVISRLGFEKPTPIQAQAIPAVMSGRDVIGVAQTGSGKTIAFLLPMFRHILNQRPLEKGDGPIALILSPTRELATQIFKDCKPFLKALDLRAICVYGGPPVKDHIAQVKAGAEIIVCTPGRMIELLAANGGRVVNLQRVTYVVLDEADRQFDMGFEPQVMKIINNVRPDRQTVLFSATFPKQMEALARRILKKPIEITVGNKSVVAPEIEQVVEVIKEEDKFARLLGLLGDLYSQPDSEDYRTLIFVDRQEGADFLLDRLLKRGYVCLSIHGGKDQVDRDQVIKDFKEGVVPILTATSVAARGLDVKQLKLVVNYDCPNHMEDYVHRVGRTGRAGQHGKAVTFVTPDQGKYARDIVKALKLSGTTPSPELEELAGDWQKLIEQGRATAAGSGFGGKGLDRFDQDRAAQKRLQRREHGDSDDEEEKQEDVFDEDGERKMPVSEGATNGTSNQAVADAVAKVHQDLFSKGQLRSGVAVDPKLPDSGEYVQRLEINDLPQKARWAVTNRTNIAKVLEQTGASITTKGSFFPAGRLPGPGEQKLHLVVEGETPVQVESAMRELRRLLSDASDAAILSATRETPTGRYNVT